MSELGNGQLALGVAVGACATLFAFLGLEYFGGVLKPTSELWAALIGALVGGTLALGAQILASASQKAERDMAKQQLELSQAYLLFEVLNDIVSIARAVSGHIERSFEEAKHVGQPFKSLAIVPITGSVEFPHIPKECKVLLLSKRKVHLYNQLQGVDTLNENLLLTFNEAQRRRSELLLLFDESLIAEGKGFVFLPGKEHEGRARNSVLEHVFLQISTDLRENEKILTDAIISTGELINSLGDSDFRFELKQTLGALQQG